MLKEKDPPGNPDCKYGCAGNENCVGVDIGGDGCPCVCHHEGYDEDYYWRDDMKREGE